MKKTTLRSLLVCCSLFSISTFAQDSKLDVTPQAAETAPAPSQGATTTTGSWPYWGGDLFNSHYARDEHIITPENVKKLKVKWKLDVGNNVATIPSYADGVLYFFDSAPAPAGVINIFKIGLGHLNAVDANTGKKLWSFPLTKYTQSKVRSMAKATPAVFKDKIIFGDSIDNVRFIPHAFFGKVRMPGASLIAVNRKTGEMMWKTELDPHFASRI